MIAIEKLSVEKPTSVTTPVVHPGGQLYVTAYHGKVFYSTTGPNGPWIPMSTK